MRAYAGCRATVLIGLPTVLIVSARSMHSGGNGIITVLCACWIRARAWEGQVGQPELDRLRFVGRPFGQQATLGEDDCHIRGKAAVVRRDDTVSLSEQTAAALGQACDLSSHTRLPDDGIRCPGMPVPHGRASRWRAWVPNCRVWRGVPGPNEAAVPVPPCNPTWRLDD